jgi:hypothetical protein
MVTSSVTAISSLDLSFPWEGTFFKSSEYTVIATTDVITLLNISDWYSLVPSIGTDVSEWDADVTVSKWR